MTDRLDQESTAIADVLRKAYDLLWQINAAQIQYGGLRSKCPACSAIVNTGKTYERIEDFITEYPNGDVYCVNCKTGELKL